jgi:hypothetical protein
MKYLNFPHCSAVVQVVKEFLAVGTNMEDNKGIEEEVALGMPEAGQAAMALASRVPDIGGHRRMREEAVEAKFGLKLNLIIITLLLGIFIFFFFVMIIFLN